MVASVEAESIRIMFDCNTKSPVRITVRMAPANAASRMVNARGPRPRAREEGRYKRWPARIIGRL